MLARTQPPEEADAPLGWSHYCFAQGASLEPFAPLVRQDRLPQGILLVGRAGLGKKALAVALASLSFCESSSACGHCGSCRVIAAGRNPAILCDYHHELAKTVEFVELAQEHLALKASRTSKHPYARRIVIIGDVEQLSLAAANRLLKTLEEPAEGACLIFTSTRPQHLLPTIRSRCIKWQIRPPERLELLSYLLNLSRSLEEGRWPELSVAILDELYGRHGGCPGAIITALDGHGVQQTAAESFLELLQTGQFTAMLAAIDKIKQDKSLSAATLAAAAEYALNEGYRALFLDPAALAHVQGSARLSPVAIAGRRNLLRSLKELASAQRIALNAPLAAEAVFYQGFLRDS